MNGIDIFKIKFHILLFDYEINSNREDVLHEINNNNFSQEFFKMKSYFTLKVIVKVMICKIMEKTSIHADSLSFAIFCDRERFAYEINMKIKLSKELKY